MNGSVVLPQSVHQVEWDWCGEFVGKIDAAFCPIGGRFRENVRRYKLGGFKLVLRVTSVLFRGC